MRGELLNVHHPHRIHIKWGIFWAVIAIASTIGIYQAAAHVRTHSLPIGQLELTLPYTKYVAGEEIAFSLTNSFNTTIFVANECPSEPLMVYKLVDSKWVRIHDTASKTDCPSEARTIAVPSNGIVTGSFARWKNLFAQPGKYRIVAYVEYYNALPYADIEIVGKQATAAAPQATAVASSAPVLNAKTVASGAKSTTVPSWNSTTVAATPKPSSTPPAPTTVPKTVTITVSPNGVYASTSITLNVGDTLKISYPTGQDEVKTFFTRTGGTTATISTITVDHEHRSGSRLMSSPGTWTYRSDQSGGNTGTLTVQ